MTQALFFPAVLLHVSYLIQLDPEKEGNWGAESRGVRGEKRVKWSETLQEKRGRDEEEYANHKVWVAVGGISSSRGNMCVGTNCRQEFIRLVV